MQMYTTKKIHNTDFYLNGYEFPHVECAGNEISFYKSPCSEIGFTLLELLVALAVAALAATVVGGSAQAFMERSQYHKAVRDVAARLGYARTLCAQEGRKVTVTYDPQTRQLAIDGNTPLQIDAAAHVAWKPLQPEDLGQPQGAQPVFVFQAHGGARGGQLTLTRATGQGVTFQVNWLLGTVEQTTALPQT